MSSERRPRILWGVTASVAAIRAPKLARAFAEVGELKAVVTEAARHFLNRSGEEWPAAIPVLADADEWSSWQQLGDPVLHIQMRQWADVLVIAPLTADAMAKLAGGWADNLLLSIARAWDFSKPMLLAPAMNTLMWRHPATAVQQTVLRGWGAVFVEPVVKELACGDTGVGALAAPSVIADAIRSILSDARS